MYEYGLLALAVHALYRDNIQSILFYFMIPNPTTQQKEESCGRIRNEVRNTNFRWSVSSRCFKVLTVLYRWDTWREMPYVSLVETDVCLRRTPQKQRAARASQLLPWILTLQKIGQSPFSKKNHCCFQFPRWFEKGKKATFLKGGRESSFKMKHFLSISFSVKAVWIKLWADLCSLRFSPLFSSALPFLLFAGCQHQ